MQQATQQQKEVRPHTLNIGGGLARLTGIDEVLGYDENTVVVRGDFGTVSLQGEALSIRDFNSQTGELSVAGSVTLVQYAAAKEKKRGFWGGLLR